MSGRSTLKTYFETGDFPTEAQFAELIDSVFNLNDDVHNNQNGIQGGEVGDYQHITTAEKNAWVSDYTDLGDTANSLVGQKGRFPRVLDGEASIGFSTGIYEDDLGKIGIGVIPENPFHVKSDSFSLFEKTGTVTNAAEAQLDLRNVTSGNMVDGFGSLLAFSIEDSADVINWVGSIGAVRDGADNAGALIFLAGTNGAEEFMRLDASGNLGVGVESPAGIVSQITLGSPSQTSTSMAIISTTTGVSSLTFGDGITGSDSYRGFIQYANNGDNMLFATATTVKMILDGLGSVVLGEDSLLAVGATDGFVYVPTMTGVPTGIPTNKTGKTPIHVDSTNNRIYAYVGGSWKYAALI